MSPASQSRRQDAVLSLKSPLGMSVLGGLLLGLGLLIAYANSFAAPFLLDDAESLERNKSIESLVTALAPPSHSGMTVAGRPLLNLSFALNRQLLGPEPASYRWGNLLIHFCAALVLWACLSRTFRLPSLCGRFGAHAGLLAWFVAALWALHPMQTESVTYLVQRAESLAGLCMFVTLYAFIRGAENRSLLWSSLCAVACLFGVASKESVAAAPLFLLLYDRCLLSGSFAGALKRRRTLYLALALSWVLLAWLVLSGGGRGATVGFARIGALDYLLTQGWGIVGYLGHAIFPAKLVFDYGAIVEKQLPFIVLGLLLTGGLFALTSYLLIRKPAAGLPGAWFFLILAPSSSLVPIATQTLAEHRMYLPLAAVALVVVLALYQARRLLVWWLGPILVVASIAATAHRNHDYRSALAIWEDTVAKVPDNARALNNLGIQYEEAGRFDEAVSSYTRAIELAPQFAQALSNLGSLLVRKGSGHLSPGRESRGLSDKSGSPMIETGLSYLARAVKLEPDLALPASNYGTALTLVRRFEEALPLLQRAYSLAPEEAAHGYNLANALMELDRNGEAADFYEKAIVLSPGDSDIRTNYGILLRRMGKIDDSVVTLQKSVTLAPDSARAHSNLGVSLLASGRRAEARNELLRAAALSPAMPQARYYLGTLLAEEGKDREAIEHYEALLKTAPPTAELLSNLGVLYAREGNISEAIRHFEQALVLDPRHEAARRNLNQLRALGP
jgi:tetratricopeptide (TPR) repeat protein